MNWHIAILVVIGLAVPISFTDENVHNCGKAHINDVIKNVRKIVEDEWEYSGDSQEVMLQKMGGKLQEILSAYENTIKDCTTEEKVEFQHALTFAIKLLRKEINPAEEALKLIEDDQVMENITALICYVNCSYVVDFANQLNQPILKVHVYRTLQNLLERTDLYNRLIDTNLPFIKDLDTVAHKETEGSVSEVLAKLLRQAITTELRLQHGKVDGLYEINHDLTSKIIHQLIEDYIKEEGKCEDHEPLYLFESLKSNANLSLYIHHLELVFQELKKHNKLRTINSLVLLRFCDDILAEVDEKLTDVKERWRTLVSELPDIAHAMYTGNICRQFDVEYNKYKAFVTFTPKGVHVMKMSPSEQGATSAFTTLLNGRNVTILMDKVPAKYNIHFGPIEVEQGNLTEMLGEEYSETTSYECQPIKELKSTLGFTKNNVAEYCMLKKFMESLLNAV